MKTGIKLIPQEQFSKHKFSIKHDWNVNGKCELSQTVSALCLINPELTAMPENCDGVWYMMMCQKSYKKRLIIAGALIASEIDRLNLKKYNHEKR